MHPNGPAGDKNGSPVSSPAEDSFLVASLLGGDDAALAKLMDRYDRLVRYAVLRASANRHVSDPQWLDAVASDTWAGFVQSVRRTPDRPPKSVAAYLVRIARNRTVSAIRRSSIETVSLDADPDRDDHSRAEDADAPPEALARIESLETLRTCVAQLHPDDRALIGQLQAITDRRWRDASAALGLSESTLRSRWERLLERLRRAIRAKTGTDFFAPHGTGRDK